ncbi:MAG: efflux RND transporter permease subunit, partial [Planctomycetes bacterium]|nr:efflux RND transporter permease subunit [Planctomycetota bacterium]
AVFFPIVFVEGVAGQLFRDQALTVVFALLMSLLVALFVIPMLAARGDETRSPPTLRTLLRRYGVGLIALLVMPGLGFVAARSQGTMRTAIASAVPLLAVVLPLLLGPRPDPALSGFGRFSQRVLGFWLGTVLLLGALLLGAASLLLWPLTKLFDISYRALEALYPRILTRALRLRAPILLGALLLLVTAAWRTGRLGNELLPAVHQGEFYLDAFLPRDATVERTDEVLQKIEGAIHALADVERTFLASGVDKKELNDSDQGEHSARILVTLRQVRDRATQEERVREQIRGIVRLHPDVRSFRFANPSVLAFNAPVVVEVFGRDILQLRRVCDRVQEVMARVPGLRDVRSTLQRGNSEVSIKLDRDKLAALKLEARMVTGLVQNKVQGAIPTLFAERERKIDMLVRVDRAGLHTLPQLLELNVNPNGNPPIPLASVAELHRREGPSEIRRIGNLRGAEVQATLSGFDLGHTHEALEVELSGLDLPRGVTLRVGGQKEEKERSLHSLTMALLLAVFLVYIVMASQFESLVQPFVILLTLPLAFVGVIFTLETLAMPLSVIVFLGAIVLAGIVVNNAIILIDQINQLRAAGQDKLRAIVDGSTRRLRPVLMTTMTTVLGLLPLTGWMGSGEGVELRAPMAVVVVTGLSVATLLTLVVIPVVYSLTDRKA